MRKSRITLGTGLTVLTFVVLSVLSPMASSAAHPGRGCDSKADNWRVRTHYVTSSRVSDLVGDPMAPHRDAARRATDGGVISKFQTCVGVRRDRPRRQYGGRVADITR
jgi:hypothetical protein